MTKEIALEVHFKKYGPIASLTMPPARDGDCVNRGFAFIAFKNLTDMESALSEDHEVCIFRRNYCLWEF